MLETTRTARTPRTAQITRRTAARGAMALAGGAALARCGVVNRETESAPKALAPAQITMLGRGQIGNQQAFEQLSARFSQEHLGVTVTYTHQAGNFDEAYLVKAAAGQVPDTAFGQAALYKGHLASGVATHVDDLAKRDKTFKEADYDAFWLAALKYKGKLGGMPWDPGMWVLFYNRSLFQQAGLRFPDATTPMTWEDTLEMAKRLTITDAGEVKQWGMELTWNRIWWHMPRALGLADFYQGDENILKIDSPVGIEALQWMTDLVTKHKVSRGPAATGPATTFETGKLAMQVAGIWTAGGVRTNLQGDWDVAPLPQFRGKKRVTTGQASPIIMGAASKFKDQAWEFMKFLGGQPGQQQVLERGLGQPMLKAMHNSQAFVGAKPPHSPQVAIAEVQHAMPSPYGPSYNDIQMLWDKTMLPVYQGQQSLTQALTSAQPEFKRILDESKRRFG